MKKKGLKENRKMENRKEEKMKMEETEHCDKYRGEDEEGGVGYEIKKHDKRKNMEEERRKRTRVRAGGGSSMFLRSVGIYLQVHTALQPRRSTATRNCLL
jgi:hypothetical protein